MEYKSSQTAEARLAELAPEIGEAIGFSLHPMHSRYLELVGPVKNARVGLRVGYPFNGKLEISGRFPPGDYYHGQKKVEISVSLSKTAEQIAKDIERRLFPDYEKALDIVNKAASAHEKFTTQVHSLGERLAKLVGGKAEGSTTQKKVSLYRSSKLPEMLGDLEVHGEDVVFDDVRMTYEEAEAVINTLIRMRASR
jgi:hypothetical protein